VVEVLDGAVVIVLVVVGIAAVVEGFGHIRVEPDRLVEVLNGAVIIVLVVVDIAAVDESFESLGSSLIASSKSWIARLYSRL